VHSPGLSVANVRYKKNKNDIFFLFLFFPHISPISKKKKVPIPGVEPGPRDGKSPILTARLYRSRSH